MTFKIYGAPGTALMAPHAVLEEVGAAYEWVRVDLKAGEHRTPEFLALNPKGRVPVLLDGDFALTEAAAICLHLAERFPQAGLLPAPGTRERARAYEWMLFLSNTVQTALMDWFHPDWLHPDEAAHAAVKAAAEARLGAHLAHVDSCLAARGRPYCLGAAVSVADFYVHMLARWTRFLAKPAYAYPSIKLLTDAMKKHPSVVRMREMQGIAEAPTA
ncbi:MAG: glutathione S-transferase family protein, partial [Rhodospirillales bacterium]|nr:glutathione S-transferase family protein [Rhodospirillales bacterium]